jgi:hypothetical protein
MNVTIDGKLTTPTHFMPLQDKVRTMKSNGELVYSLQISETVQEIGRSTVSKE